MKDFDFTPEPSNAVLIGGAILPRELTDLSIWKKTPADAAHALCDLFLMANNEKGAHRLEGGMEVNYEPGWCLWSNKALADRWGWKRETVERFMVELEKSEIILRPDLGQNRKAIILRDFVQLSGHPLGHPKEQPTGQLSGQPTGQPKDTERARARVQSIESGASAPPRIIELETVLAYFRANRSGFTDDQVTEQFRYYDAMRHPVTGDWQRPVGKLGVMTPISDWRSEMSRALSKFATGGSEAGAEKNGGGQNGESPAQALFRLDRRIKDLNEQIDGFEDTQPELAEKLRGELAAVQAERSRLA